MFEVISALRFGELVEAATAAFPERIDGSFGSGAEELLEFGEGQLELFVVTGDVPRGRFVAKSLETSDAAAVEALAGQGTPFVLGQCSFNSRQPTAVLGRVAELQPSGERAGWSAGKAS